MPQAALLATGLFIIYLFWRDSGRQPKASSAVWIPCMWMVILGSRSVSEWLNLGTVSQSADQLLEGSPLDATFFVALMSAASLVLWRKRVPWRELFRNNVWLSVFYLYC